MEIREKSEENNLEKPQKQFVNLTWLASVTNFQNICYKVCAAVALPTRPPFIKMSIFIYTQPTFLGGRNGRGTKIFYSEQFFKFEAQITSCKHIFQSNWTS